MNTFILLLLGAIAGNLAYRLLSKRTTNNRHVEFMWMVLLKANNGEAEKFYEDCTPVVRFKNLKDLDGNPLVIASIDSLYYWAKVYAKKELKS